MPPSRPTHRNASGTLVCGSASGSMLLISTGRRANADSHLLDLLLGLHHDRVARRTPSEQIRRSRRFVVILRVVEIDYICAREYQAAVRARQA